MLLRIGRRRESFSAGDPHTFAETEFLDKNGQFDLRLSVYRLESADHIVRCHAEHAAAAPIDPPRGGRHIDLPQQNGQLVHQPVDGCPFAFLSSVHYELRFNSESDVLALAEAVIKSPPVAVETTRPQLREYAARMIDSGDPEWLKALMAMRDPGGWMTADLMKKKTVSWRVLHELFA